METKDIIELTAATLLRAGTTFRPDQLTRYQQQMELEGPGSPGAWVIGQILDNARCGQRNCRPLCDDTGIPHLFLEIGDEAMLPAGFFAAVEEGVAQGLRQLPGRPMAVRGNDLERITQEQGLFDDPGLLAPAPVQIRHIPGKTIRLTVLMLGGGPEIRGKTQRVFHKHSLDVVADEMTAWAVEGAQLLGCQPCALFFGIGRSNVEAASLALEAMKEADFSRQSPLEQRITEQVNASGIGPLGLGGVTTALGAFVKVGPQRASGVRVISLRVGCCFDPRRASCEWQG